MKALWNSPAAVVLRHGRRWLTHCCSCVMELFLWATLSGAVLAQSLSASPHSPHVAWTYPSRSLGTGILNRWEDHSYPSRWGDGVPGLLSPPHSVLYIWSHWGAGCCVPGFYTIKHVGIWPLAILCMRVGLEAFGYHVVFVCCRDGLRFISAEQQER